MIIRSAKFVISSQEVNKCPKSELPEYAFIGRSNVGKSSLINMLTKHKKLAKISSTPGKTQLVNHFLINENWHLVDLPGYGYAKISKTERERWGKMIHKYLMKRENLFCTFLLIDIRLEPQKIDLEFIDWLGSNQLPFVIIFTKSDKLNKLNLVKNTDRYKKELSKRWTELPQMIVNSSKTGQGREAILELISYTNQSNSISN
ncbi:MAG: YihA family ribosome biogenesis GTP-binding protein [Bacteroidetes bacterium]|nr:YihA family ribosome biogenesis GTP-binding protein [Bacteroidota bacterium]